ncbi:MAG: PKD domain-containing protein [Gammaproteobacteria bacterium]|nr:PKD domain-containing protein [Gammaproteobacteria bacterium]
MCILSFCLHGKAFAGLYDDFSDMLDLSKWEVEADEGVSISQTAGRLELSILSSASGDSFGGGIKSTHVFSGDFDVQVDFSLVSWPSENGVRSALGLSSESGGGFIIERSASSPGDNFLERYIMNGSEIRGSSLTSDKNGKLRLLRVGNLITGYAFDTTLGWQTVASYTNDELGIVNSDLLTIALSVWSHDYVFNPGEQPVTVSFDNMKVTATQEITVTEPVNQSPTALITVTPTSGTVPLTIALDGSSSTDSDGTIPSYSWSSSDGQTATGSGTSFTFSSAGDYVITLTVTDDGGATSSTTTTVTATELQLPVASFTATPTTGSVPLTVTLDGNGSTTPNDSIIAYQWSSSDGQNEIGSTTSFTFDAVGIYIVTHTIIDNTGQTASTTQEITVIDSLTASFTATPTTGTAPLTVSLDASSSTTPNSSIIAYTWSSSDGQSAAGSTASLTYGTAGDYSITLTTIDNEGNTATATETINVESGDGSSELSYNTTARLSPQVIAAGITPTQVNYGDEEFDIVALVRPGVLAIDRVTFRDSATSAFALQMNSAGVLENGDELYKATFSFDRGSFGDFVMHSAWGPDDGQYNIIAYDTAEQRSHQFPDLMFGSNVEQSPVMQEEADVSYNAIKRLGPQVLIAGFSPSKIDVTDTDFDVIAVVRDGVLPIETVTVTQNQSLFELAMSNAGTLSNGDKVYKMSYTFQRNAFGTATLNTLWGDQPGQFNIHATDSAQQRSHDFPDIMFGNFPAQ